MTRDRLTSADLRTILLVALLGAVGIGIALRYYSIAFPEASINFKVSRAEIEQRARNFLEQRGFDLAPYRQLTLFRYDETAKIYLERELGLEEANRLMASEINVWRWKVRFFKPPEKEELLAWFDPAGQLVGFEHIIEEKAPAARLEKAQARGVAEIFLRTRLGLDLDDYVLVEDTMNERPNRLDYLFTWERRNFKAREATYRISTSVYGDEVGKVLPFLKVPEQWQRDYERLRSRNESFAFAANLFVVPLFIAMVAVLIRRARQRQIDWKPLLWLSGIVGVVTAIANINILPLASETFPTSTSYPTFIATIILTSLLVGLLITLLIAMVAASGDALYREVAPDKVALPRLFTFSGLRTKEFFTATLVGYALAAFQVGFVVAFYLIARRFGAWSPAEVKYDDFLSTTLPWIYPLTVGLQAATVEEFGFRLFAVPFLKKYLKSTWLAVLIPAFVWGFLHSGYPQQPAWIRGVEVGLVGVVFGFVLLRFGILATLVTHYTYNAAMIGLLLLRSDNLYFMLSGGLVMDAMLIPLAIAAALYWQHRRFAAEPDLFNSAPVSAPPAVPEAPALEPVEGVPVPGAAVAEPAYVPLARKKLGLAAACGIVGLALWMFLPVEQPFEFLRWQKGPQDAEAIADAFLRERGIKPEDWRRATTFERHLQTASAEYVRRQDGIDRVRELWSNRLPLSVASWRVRYFRPLQKEEHRVYVGHDGQVAGHDHLLEEKAPGGNLSQLEAQQRAAAYLTQTHQLDPSGWRLAESKLEKREARTDHHLIWEDPQEVVAGAYVRAEVNVRGDEASGYRSYLKVPEEWLREINKLRIQDIIFGAILVLLVIWLLILGGRRLPQHRFRWRIYIGLAVLVSAVNLVPHLNRLRRFGEDYSTSVPWQTYVFQQVGSIVLAAMGMAILTFLVVLAADLFYGARSSQALLPLQSSGGSSYYRDAVLAGISVGLVFQGVGQLYGYFKQRFPVPQRGLSASFGAAMDSYVPALTAGIDSTLGALFLVALLGIAVGVLKDYFRSTAWRVTTVASLLLLWSIPGSIVPREVFQRWGFNLLMASLIVLVMRYLLRANVLAYLVAFTFSLLSSDVLFYWHQPNPTLRGNALIAIIVAAVVLLAFIVFLRRSGGEYSGQLAVGSRQWGIGET